MFFVNSNEVIDKLVVNPELKDNITIVYDTEFTSKSKMVVDSIQLYIPELCQSHALVYPYEELSNDFRPWDKPLLDLGIEINSFDENSITELCESIVNIFEDIKSQSKNSRQLKKNTHQSINDGLFDDLLAQFNLDKSYLQYVYDKREKDGEIIIKCPNLDLNLMGFFSDVDLFKIVGKDYHDLILDSKLESRRIIKFGNRNILELQPAFYNGKLYEPRIFLKDVLNRFPVLSGNGLENQCNVYCAEIGKLNLESMVKSDLLRNKSKSEIMSDMTLLKSLEPTLFYQYAGIDPIATYSLNLKHQELLNGIRNDFNLEITDVNDTTGSNVGKFIIDLYVKHFVSEHPEIQIETILETSKGIVEKTLDSSQIVTHQRKLSTLDHTSNLDLNNFGLQTFRTVGGLLYTRCAKYPSLIGKFGDLDQKSCYSTKLSNMNVYLGCPIVSTFKAKKYKPKMKDVIDFLLNNCYRDAWFIRVSGKLSKAINTLILSDLRFKNKREKFNTIWDKRLSSQYVREFNAYKIASKDAESTILSKEIKFGIVTQDILDCLKLLPNEWFDEYLNLLVDAVVFIPKELCCNNLLEFQSKFEIYPDEQYIEEFDVTTGLKKIESIYSKSNLSLVFPANIYFEKLRDKRAYYKKQNNPIQEVYKLFSNSAYGSLACEHLPCNNLLAANIITASARSTAWLMINALNGFQVITDGCTFSWNNIPIGLKFKDILVKNPNYLLHFQTEIKSNISVNDSNCQLWIDNNFKQHLKDFYNVDSNHIPVNLYDFELKDEKFGDNKHYIFTKFINHGSGSYVKGLDENMLLVESTDFNLSEPKFTKIKARSFKGTNQELLKWYVESSDNKYLEPVIYSENQIIKFGLGNVLAIHFLKTYKLDSIAHPMGFSRVIYKLMKLITRSQFIFQNESQLRNFEKNLNKLNNLGKLACDSKFWNSLDISKLTSYGQVELYEDFNYVEYCKTHNLGLGLEFLTFSKSHLGSIQNVRQFLSDKIDLGKCDFNATLQIDRFVRFNADKLKYLFGFIYAKRVESEIKLKNLLIESSNEPTIFTVNYNDIQSLEAILGCSDDFE